MAENENKNAENKRKVELTLDETSQKEFERLKYALSAASDIQLCQKSFDYLIVLLRLTEQGYNLFVPGRFIDDKTIDILKDKNGTTYIEIPIETMERLRYWRQLQKVYDDIKDNKKPENG